jgi:DNA-binding transcriptional MocR family regulator
VEGIAQSVRQVSRNDVASLVEYSQPQGDPLLRQQICMHLTQFGIDTNPQQLLVTHSASQALDLVVRLMLKPGDTAFVEDPGYFNLFGLLKLHGVKLIGIPRRATGPDIEITEALLAEHRPKLFFVNTIFHNPTATNVSPQVAFKLLQLAHQYGFSIIEDDVYADFEPTPSQRLATLDQFDRVIYLGGFSKTLSSSLRLGYLAGRQDLIKRLVVVKALTSMGGVHLVESLIASLLERGTHRKHLDRLRRRLSHASSDAVSQLQFHGWEVYERPVGGMFVWAKVPGIDDSGKLVDTARRFGLDLAPGKDYRPNNDATPWMRLNVAYTCDLRTRPFLEAAAELGRHGA